LRFSLGRTTTQSDVAYAADVIAAVVARQRK
jgi:cysteine sulfinate desulfinase/cysteine desulfurase-like protein